jgi:hypothetical protein
MALFLGSLFGNVILGLITKPKMSKEDFYLQLEKEKSRHKEVMARLKRELVESVQNAAYQFLQQQQELYAKAATEIRKVSAEIHNQFVRGIEAANATANETLRLVNEREGELLLAIITLPDPQFDTRANAIHRAMESARRYNQQILQSTLDVLERGLNAALAGEQAALQALANTLDGIVKVVEAIVAGALGGLAFLALLQSLYLEKSSISADIVFEQYQVFRLAF